MTSPSPEKHQTTTSEQRGLRYGRVVSGTGDPGSPTPSGRAGGNGRPAATDDFVISPELRTALASIPGVDRVIVSDDDRSVWLQTEPHQAAGRLLQAAQQLLEGAGVDPESVQLDVMVSATRRERRIRFDSAERIENRDRSISVRVTLEWEGVLQEAVATGEKGEHIELRTAAQAALLAIEKVTDQPLNLRLVGVKHVRAFDGELVVVSIFGGAGRKTLLGAVLAGTDPFRATAVAVLMALNRLLGNYLVTR